MTLKTQIDIFRQSFFDDVADFFKSVAAIFGFPENPGLPIFPQKDYEWAQPSITSSLPVNPSNFPPMFEPRNYFEIIFGRLPPPQEIPRIFYESKIDGYYNFYIPNYKNIFFLPDWFSEFLQIRCKFCLDITLLETARELLFVILLCYFYIVQIRTLLSWLCIINPYTQFLSYFISLVDWVEEATHGFIPSIGGTNYTFTLLLMLIGRLADSLNHLVFTMPFLPGEGVMGKAVIEGEVKNVLIFKHLPYLWYKYPIPNEVRKFWSYQRPEILKYMQKYYGHLNIDLLPDLTNITDHIINNSK